MTRQELDQLIGDVGDGVANRFAIECVGVDRTRSADWPNDPHEAARMASREACQSARRNARWDPEVTKAWLGSGLAEMEEDTSARSSMRRQAAWLRENAKPNWEAAR